MLIDRNLYLMTELVQDVHEVSLENGHQDGTIKHTHLVKKGLSKNSEILLDFILLAKNRLFTAGKLIHANTLEGASMRDDDICLSFARMTRCHIEKSTGREPLSLSEFINNLKSHQPLLPSLFNTIVWILKPKAGMTSLGYVKVESKFLGDRIWSISSE